MSNPTITAVQSLFGNLFGGTNRILVIGLGILIILVAVALLIASRAPAAIKLVGALPTPIGKAARTAGAVATAASGTGA